MEKMIQENFHQIPENLKNFEDKCRSLLKYWHILEYKDAQIATNTLMEPQTNKPPDLLILLI